MLKFTNKMTLLYNFFIYIIAMNKLLINPSLIFLFILIPCNVFASKTDSSRITLSATNQIEYQPTSVTIDFTITSFASTPDNSFNIYKKRSDSLITTLQSIPKVDDVHSKSFNLVPKYDYQERTKILQGYDTNGYFTLKTQTESLGVIINLLAENNVNSISNIIFSASISELEEMKAKSSAKALALSIIKAETILSQLELKEYKIKNIIISDSNISKPNFRQSGLLLSNHQKNENVVIPGKQSLSTTATIEVEFK